MITAMIATFVLVFLRAFQQQNVIHRHFAAAALTSFAMAAAEVGLILQIINHTWSAVPWIGAGGAMGVTLSMIVHGLLLGGDND